MDTKLSPGVHLIGKAVGDFEIIGGMSGKGRPYQFVKGKVLAGDTFVTVTHSVAVGQQPILPKSGEDVVALVVPGFKANGLLALDVQLQRPEVVGAVGLKK